MTTPHLLLTLSVSTRTGAYNPGGTPPDPIDLPMPNEYFTGDTAAIQIAETDTTINIKVGDQYEGKLNHAPGNKHIVQSVPVGMTIGLKTGTIRWCPTPDQAGSHTCSFTTAGATRTLTFVVAANAAFIMPDAATCGWISNRAATSGTGTYNNPAAGFSKFRTSTNNKKSTKRVIYLRGGTYPLSAAHEGPLTGATSIPALDIFGTASEPLEIRPWGNERPKLRGNDGVILRVDSAYLTIADGIEFMGESANIEYPEAIADWWNGAAKYNSNGLAVAGSYITVRGCVFHEVLTQAIAFKGATNIIAEDNIVANSARWTIAGTTAIGMVSCTPSTDAVSVQSNIIRRNLIFGVESRIYSHVFSKGEAHLDVDEGEAILIQPTNITGQGAVGYQGRFLIENNVCLWGGKGIVVNTAEHCDVLNNTLYNMGGSLATPSAGLRSNKGWDSTWRNNLVYVADNPSHPELPRRQGVSFSQNEPGKVAPICTDNWIQEDGSNLSTRIPGMNYTPNAFASLTTHRPTRHGSVPSGIGAADSVYDTLYPKALSYSVDMEPSTYHLSIDYADMTRQIINNLPAGLTADFSNWHNTLPYTDGNGVQHDEFEVPITGNLAQLDPKITSFKLIVVHPYTR